MGIGYWIFDPSELVCHYAISNTQYLQPIHFVHKD